MSKTLFSETYACFLDFFHIKPRAISKKWEERYAEISVTEDAIRGWRTRDKPKLENLECLIETIIDLLEDKKVNLSLQLQDLIGNLKSIWGRYGIECSMDNLSKNDFEEVIKTIFEFAYSSSAQTIEHYKRRVVAFDLDGTLVKGIRHSWTILWQAIGKTSEDATRHKKAFEEGKISYEAWCESDREALHFGGLTQKMVEETAKKCGCSLTKNLEQAVEYLHNHNCKVVIISGGADCLLTALLPNAYKVFDDICINKCVFGEDGILTKIIPTLYDWDKDCLGVQGKEAGFELMCQKYDAKLEDSVFVGDDRNDFRAMGLAGMKIFYHSFSGNDTTRGITKGAIKREMPGDTIIEGRNDLMVVARRIVDWDFGD